MNRTRAAIIIGLGAMGLCSPVWAGGGDGTPTVGAPSAEVVARSRLVERAGSVLQEAARSTNAELRANAVEAMSASPGRLAAVARDALRDESVGVRAVAALAVGKSGLREVEDALRPLLGDESAYVRASALGALAMLGADVDLTPLADMALTASSSRVRAHAAYVLGEVGDRSAVRLLREAAQARVPRTSAAEVRLLRLQIAEALVKLGDEESIHAVRAALYPSRPEELEATALAVQILGTLGDRGAVDELILLSERRDERGGQMPAEIRLAVAAALAQLGERQGAFVAEEFWRHPSAGIRAQSAIVFGLTTGSRNMSRLETMLGDADPRVRVAAAAGVLRIAARGE